MRIEKQTERARWLLQNVKHAAMATVNDDGTPHNTPYLFMISDDLKELYWGSHPESIHSKNIYRDGNLFVVLYEANERGGLYIKACNGRIAEGKELDRSLKKHNELRTKYGSEPLPRSYYGEGSIQKMHVADIRAFWVNYEECDKDGHAIRDCRAEIKREDLL